MATITALLSPQTGHSNMSSSFLGEGPDARTVPEAVVIGISLGIIVLSTIVGNLFVIFAIIIEKDLRRPQYLLILSLAVADLLVGCVVTPISTVYELQKRWTLGTLTCDAWTSVDVLVCTSSILHLVAIAIDRYWSVTDISYAQRRTPKRIGGMLLVVWLMSLCLSLAPFLGWKDDGFQRRVEVDHVCLISQAVSYQIFSTATAFYLPLLIIMFIYWRVFKAAKRRFQRERDRKAPQMANDPRKSFSYAGQPSEVSTLNGTGDSTNMPSTPRTPHAQNGLTPHNGVDTQVMTVDGGATDVVTLTNQVDGRSHKRSILRMSLSLSMSSKRKLPTLRRRRRRKKGEKESLDEKRERKAWRTLAIITGTFVMCWLPFFLLAIARPLFDFHIARPLEGFVGWLGYLNSSLNPIIYTIFSPDFRLAFKKMLRRMITWKK